MGLRETKATRTREKLIETALRLFRERGFDATTMEDVAREAEVGTSTLYRYFPAKTLLLQEPVDRWGGHIARALAERPADEPVDLAVAAALADGMARAAEEADRIALLREVIDETPAARAHLWDLWVGERELLARELSARMGLDAQDRRVTSVAMSAMGVVALVLDEWREPHTNAPGPGELARIYAAHMGFDVESEAPS